MRKIIFVAITTLGFTSCQVNPLSPLDVPPIVDNDTSYKLPTPEEDEARVLSCQDPRAVPIPHGNGFCEIPDTDVSTPPTATRGEQVDVPEPDLGQCFDGWSENFPNVPCDPTTTTTTTEPLVYGVCEFGRDSQCNGEAEPRPTLPQTN